MKEFFSKDAISVFEKESKARSYHPTVKTRHMLDNERAKERVKKMMEA